VGAYTAYDDSNTGLTYILEFHEGLWFGSRLRNSLWNPNQSRAFGVSVCDDPWDPNCDLGFHDPVSDMFVPLAMDGVAFVKTRVPSTDEVYSCPHIVMTSDSNWDPSNMKGRMLTQEEKEQMHLQAGVRTGDVYVDACHGEIQFVNGASEDKCVLASMLTALCDRTMFPCLLSKVQVATYVNDEENMSDAEQNIQGERAVSVGATFSKTRHSKITPEELARKWRVGLQTARNTLKTTTQFGVRHAIHPLKRRYRTDNMQTCNCVQSGLMQLYILINGLQR